MNDYINKRRPLFHIWTAAPHWLRTFMFHEAWWSKVGQWNHSKQGQRTMRIRPENMRPLVRTNTHTEKKPANDLSLTNDKVESCIIPTFRGKHKIDDCKFLINGFSWLWLGWLVVVWAEEWAFNKQTTIGKAKQKQAVGRFICRLRKTKNFSLFSKVFFSSFGNKEKISTF